MNLWRASGLALLGALAAAPAVAQEAPPAFASPNLSASGVRALASGCAMCHGPEGRPVAGSAVAALAGKRADAFVAAMNAFKQAKGEATVMRQIAGAYGDAEVAALADYFSKRAP
jgi:cytochrome subunit of sulfide dehydrogenase